MVSLTYNRDDEDTRRFAHAYLLSDEESDAIRLGLLFLQDDEQVSCQPFNERTHTSIHAALTALTSEASDAGVEELRVTMLKEVGAFKIAIDQFT